MNKPTARVTAETHSVWHASVYLSNPTMLLQGACEAHTVIGVESAAGTAPCWRCGADAPVFLFPAAQATYIKCEHDHRSPEAAERCGRSIASKSIR